MAGTGKEALAEQRQVALTDPSSGQYSRLRGAWRSGPLGVPAFWMLAVGQGTSTIGDCCYAVALPWLVLSGHGSALSLGVVLACYGVPQALLTVPGGTLADRFGPRLVMLVADGARCVLTAVLAVLAARHASSPAALAPVAAALGGCSGLFLPASMTLMPSVIDDALLARANALYMGFFQAGSAIGPAVGGVLVATAGPGAALVVDACSYLVSAVSLALIGRALVQKREMPRRASRHLPAAGGIWALLRSEPTLRTVLTVSVTASFAVAATTEVALPALAHARYGAGGYGAVLACVGVMSVIGALVVGRAGEQLVGTVLIAGGFLVAAVAIAAAPFLLGLPGLAACLSVFGLALGFDSAVWRTVVQRWAPPELLGRVWGVLMLAPEGSYPLAAFVSGTLTQRLGPALVFPVCGALLALSYLFGLSHRGFRELGRQPGRQRGDNLRPRRQPALVRRVRKRPQRT